MDVELHGYHLSVYTWIARLALHEKGVAYRTVEVNPFSATGHPAHPFGKVPLLVHDGFRVYETAAITRYVDAAFEGRALQPAEPRMRARGDQIIAVVDSYGYWPLVRQVAAHGFFVQDGDGAEIDAGMKAAPAVLAALEPLVGEQGVLSTGELSLADLHLGPMIEYFCLVPAGAQLLAGYSTLSQWRTEVAGAPGMAATRPNLPAR